MREVPGVGRRPVTPCAGEIDSDFPPRHSAGEADPGAAGVDRHFTGSFAFTTCGQRKHLPFTMWWILHKDFVGVVAGTLKDFFWYIMPLGA